MHLKDVLAGLHHSPIWQLPFSGLLYEVMVSLALLGIGRAVLRLLRRESMPTGVALCTGLAVWLGSGGVFNVFGIATKPVIVCCLLIGLALFVREVASSSVRGHWSMRLHNLIPKSKLLRVLAVPLAAVMALLFAAHMAEVTFNRYDDLQGYLAFAEKASTFGSLQPDPFSERRVTSGVGGTIYLNVTMLAGTDVIGVDYLDGSLGFLAVLLCLGALTRSYRLREGPTMLVMLAACFFTFGRANLTSVHFGAAIFLSLLFVLLNESNGEEKGLASPSILSGLLLGTAFTLKSSNIPFCAAFLLTAGAAAAWRKHTLRPLVQVMLSGAVSILLCTPWAIKHYRDEGTLLFPSLGAGYHIVSYGFPKISATVTRATAILTSLYDTILPLLALVAVWAMLRRGAPVRRTSVLAFLFAAFLTAPLFSLAIAGEDLDRFLLPITNICVLILLCTVMAAVQDKVWELSTFAGVLLLLVWSGGFLQLARTQQLYVDADLGRNLLYRGPLPWFADVYLPKEMHAAGEKVEEAQISVPAGAVILENVRDAFGFNWRRNSVLIADYPGMASPRPGFPLDGNPESVRKYLLQQGVSYVVLDTKLIDPTNGYRTWRALPMTFPNTREIFVQRSVHGYAMMEHEVSTQTQNLLLALVETHTPVYRKNDLIVIPLNDTPASQPTQTSSRK